MENDTSKRKSSGGGSAGKGAVNPTKKGRKVSISSRVDARGSIDSGSVNSKSQKSDANSAAASSSFKSDDDPIAKMFRVTNPDVRTTLTTLARLSAKQQQPQQQSDTSINKDEKQTESEHSFSFEQGDQGEIDIIEKSEGEETFLIGESRDDLYGNYLDDSEEEEEELKDLDKSRSQILREMWESISEGIKETFETPSRVYKLRGYHSEPDLSLCFDEKFTNVKFDPKKKKMGKSISFEDIVSSTFKEHPNLVKGILSEIHLRAYAIDEKTDNSWRELFELEKKRFSFFDELFAMGYIVDSLEVLSSPPKGDDGKPFTSGEYFIEADEKHYRKKVDYGRVIFKTKNVYTGNFHDWYFQGPGRYSWQDGTVYQGEFSQGLMHGPGSIHWPDGSVYEGHFIEGIRTGWGIYSSADGHTYAGEWLDGLPHGHGKMWYDPEEDDNDYYEGQWERGQPQGIGTRQYATGDRYIGNWENGCRNGYGIMIWLKERQVYKGGWLDGVPHGHGKHIWYLERSSTTNHFPTRHVYQGDWVLGKREGVGKMIYACGSVYEGGWKNGQRHGKGMFLNPAGDIIMGLFRAGTLLGGSEVPLHVPTYECDFEGLTDWLTARLSLSLNENKDNKEILSEIVKRYLPFLRILYHRAGEFSQKYGNHGLYPAYLKKTFGYVNQSERKKLHVGDEHYPAIAEGRLGDNPIQHHRDYTTLDETVHMRGKLEKPETLDGVNPVTRFGLWLLLRDCDGLFDEVTMAYYDKIWCETPPISFQTRHNPFEPVYLWQFLEALIATSIAYYVEIPRKRLSESDRLFIAEDVAISETTLNSGISYDEHKRQLIIRRRRLRARDRKLSDRSQIPITELVEPTAILKGKSSHRHKKESMMQPADKKGQNKKQEGTDNAKTNRTKSVMHRPHAQSKTAEMMKAEQGSSKTHHQPKKSMRKSRAKSLFHHESPHEVHQELSSAESNETVEAAGPDKIVPPIENEESEEEGDEYDDEEEDDEEGEEDEDEFFESPISIAQCFERFINEKLLPCLKRRAGENLPVVPQPLPALVDMYEAFKGIKGREVLKGTEFLRSSLPHLLFPNPKDVLWWHRSPEPLSLNSDLDELFESFRRKFAEPETHFSDDESDDKLQSEYLGDQARKSETTMRLLNICKDSSDQDQCKEEIEFSNELEKRKSKRKTTIMPDQVEGAEEAQIMSEFTQEGHMFSKDELPSTPFLWADDYKCIPVPRKYQHFENIEAQDVIDVFNVLFPKLCHGQQEKNLHFELLFCDWLWCTSLLAKTSTEREYHEAWKTQPTPPPRPLTNPQSLGVFAHYIRQIKNNPYLSPHPPPDFKPRQPTPAPAQTRESHDGKPKVSGSGGTTPASAPLTFSRGLTTGTGGTKASLGGGVAGE